MASSTSHFTPQEVQQRLNEDFPDRRWLTVLEVFQATGVADRQQILAATELSRNPLSRLERTFKRLAPREIIREATGTFSKPGARGKPPRVYLLGPLGAALLREQGHPRARPSNLTTETAISHARALTELYLLAIAAELDCQVETNVAYGASSVLRPDAAITLPSSNQALFEIEQHADLSLLPRIVESLRHKVAFFSSTVGQRWDPHVRVLFNLTRNRTWDKSVAVWQRGCAIVAAEEGDQLPFEILGLPLPEFCAQPDWADSPAVAGWNTLFDPAQVRSFTPKAPSASAVAVQDRAENAPRHGHSRKSKPSSALPAPLRRYTPQENYWIILAYREHILQQGPHLVAQEQPPSPLLFETFKVIHMASHGPTSTPWEAVLHPQAALYLLREYLDLHPQLRTALNAAIVRGSGAMRWSTPTIQHRMLNVGDLFLRYHGLRRGQGLSVSIRPPWKEQSAGNFEFAVRLQPEILLGTNDGLVPTREEAQQAATALAWCLQALFAYAPDLGLKTAPFW